MVVGDDFFENFASVTRRLFVPFLDITPFALLEAKCARGFWRQTSLRDLSVVISPTPPRFVK